MQCYFENRLVMEQHHVACVLKKTSGSRIRRNSLLFERKSNFSGILCMDKDVQKRTAANELKVVLILFMNKHSEDLLLGHYVWRAPRMIYDNRKHAGL